MSTNHEIISDDRHLQLYYAAVASRNELLPAHWHEHLEILLIVNGGMTAWSGQQSRHLAAGDIFIASPGDIHFTKSDEHCLYYMLQVPPAHLKRIGPDWHTLHCQKYVPAQSEPGAALSAILQQINDLNESHAAGSHLLLLSKVYELLYVLSTPPLLLEQYVESGRKQQDRQRIARCLDYVQDHYQEPITLADAANLLSVTSEHFCRLFKKQTGQTFLAYVSQIRMHHFYQDLLRTDLPISLLLDQNGITNYKSFLKQFRSSYGASPQQIRKQYGNLADAAAYAEISPTDTETTI